MRGQLAQIAAMTASVTSSGATISSIKGQDLKQRISVASERFGLFPKLIFFIRLKQSASFVKDTSVVAEQKSKFRTDNRLLFSAKHVTAASFTSSL